MSSSASQWSLATAVPNANGSKMYVSNVYARHVVGGIEQRHPIKNSSILVPPGSVITYAGTTAPGGWLLCDGSEYDRRIYSALYDVIGTTYGNGDGETTFNVPDIRGRQIVGLKSSDSDFDELGETGGEKRHTLTIDEMPSHNHGVTDPGHAHGVTDPGHAHNYYNNVGDQGVNTLTTQADAADQVDYLQTTSTNTTGVTVNTNTTGISINNTGGDQSHNVLDPYFVLNYIIKV